MSLASVSSLKAQFLALKPTTDRVSACTAMANLVGSFCNNVQASPGGSVGILTFSNSAMADVLMTMRGTVGNDWITKFASAWEAGISSGIITPGTITNAAWTVSSVDLSASVSNLSAAKAILVAGLSSVNASNNPPQPLAKAISDAMLAITFLATGTSVGPTPVPLPFTAQ